MSHESCQIESRELQTSVAIGSFQQYDGKQCLDNFYALFQCFCNVSKHAKYVGFDRHILLAIKCHSKGGICSNAFRCVLKLFKSVGIERVLLSTMLVFIHEQITL